LEVTKRNKFNTFWRQVMNVLKKYKLLIINNST